MTTEVAIPDQWAIVDLFGHGRIAGRISEQTLGGGTFVRIDVPATDGQPEFTRLYDANAIYSITFVGKEIAKVAAAQIRERPINVYLPKLEMLRAGQGPPFTEEEPEL